MNRALQKLHVFRLRWSDLDTLPDGDKALFSLASFMVSEINSLNRMLLFTIFTVDDDASAEEVAAIQRNLVLRTNTLKLFECQKTIARLAASEDLSHKAIQVVRAARGALEAANLLEGYSVAKAFRNKISGHYDYQQALKNTRAVSDDFECSMYIAEESGNSFFPIGERIVFDRIIIPNSNSDLPIGPNEASIDSWIQWSLEVGRCVRKFHFDLFETLIAPLVDGRKTRPRQVWIDPELVGKHPGFRVPLFLRADT